MSRFRLDRMAQVLYACWTCPAVPVGEAVEAACAPSRVHVGARHVGQRWHWLTTTVADYRFFYSDAEQLAPPRGWSRGCCPVSCAGRPAGGADHE